MSSRGSRAQLGMAVCKVVCDFPTTSALQLTDRVMEFIVGGYSNGILSARLKKPPAKVQPLLRGA